MSFSAALDTRTAIDVAGELALNLNSDQSRLFNRLLSLLEAKKPPELHQYIFTLSSGANNVPVDITTPSACKINGLWVYGNGYPISYPGIVFDNIIPGTVFAVDFGQNMQNPAVIRDVLLPQFIRGSIYTRSAIGVNGLMTVVLVLEQLEQTSMQNGR